MTSVVAVDVPLESSLYPTLLLSDFYDAYQAPLGDPGRSPADIFLNASRATPRWVGQLMTLRNFLVRQIGLKDVGSMNPSSHRDGTTYRPGDRMGIFTVLQNSDAELLLGIDDRHLDVRVSITKTLPSGTPRYTVSTAVYVKNWLGRLYMLPVGRIHPYVVRAMMRRADV
jgi:hypothetical protein